MARKIKEQHNDASNHKVKSIKKQAREFLARNKQNLRPISQPLPDRQYGILAIAYDANNRMLDDGKNESIHVFNDADSSYMQCDTPEAIQANTDSSPFSPTDESMNAAENTTSTKLAVQISKLANENGQVTDGGNDMELADENPFVDTYTGVSSNKKAKAVHGYNNLYITAGFDMDILNYQLHREQQKIGKLRRNYMHKQDEINVEMRAVLIDWFIDVCGDFRLSTATFFLAVSLVDRLLSSIKCPRSKLQLVGATAIFIAAKMEEIYPPRLSDMVYVTDDTYTADQIIKMEVVILHVIGFEVNAPNARSFADFFVLFKPISPIANSLLGCLLELSVVHYECIRFKSSYIAAAAYALAVFCSSNKSESGNSYSNSNVTASWKPSNFLMQSVASLFGCWPEELIRKTRIARDQLREPTKTLALLHRNAAMDQRLRAVYSKYATSEKYQVSRAIRMPDEDFFSV
ncbi:cyclin-A2 [Ditylenchus destructor]|nr:cyclin-A2 [Ditylenchus destructor]